MEILPVPHEQAFVATVKVLEAQGDPAFIKDIASGLIITGRARHGTMLPMYEQYVVAFEQATPLTTRITFRLLSHYKEAAENVFSRLVLKPNRRMYVYKRAAWFVDRLKASLR